MITTAPDLMRRFIPTPHRTTFCTPSSGVLVMSNDSDLIQHLHTFSPQCEFAAEWVCKLLRDCESPPTSQEDICFGHDALLVQCYRSGTQFVADRDSKEVFGFIAPNDPADRVADFLIRFIACISY